MLRILDYTDFFTVFGNLCFKRAIFKSKKPPIIRYNQINEIRRSYRNYFWSHVLRKIN